MPTWKMLPLFPVARHDITTTPVPFEDMDAVLRYVVLAVQFQPGGGQFDFAPLIYTHVRCTPIWALGTRK